MDVSIDEQSRKYAQYVPGTLKVHNIVRDFRNEGTISNLKFFYTTADTKPFTTEHLQLAAPIVKEGMFVIVKYDECAYPGKVLDVKDDFVKVKCMERCGRSSSWKWPSTDDILDYRQQDVVCIIIKPPQLSKSSNFTAISYEVPEMADLNE